MINVRRLAVISIEFQKQWTEKGLYHSLIKRQMESRNVLANTRSLLEEARELDYHIIHAPLIIDPNKKRGWFAHMTRGRVFTAGTWKSEIVDDFYREGDLVTNGRYGFDAFAGSNLEDVLTSNNIEHLFLCGFTTDQCVAKTMRSALNLGFDCYLVSDCTATFINLWQRRIERRFKDRVLSHTGVLDFAN